MAFDPIEENCERLRGRRSGRNRPLNVEFERPRRCGAHTVYRTTPKKESRPRWDHKLFGAATTRYKADPPRL
jgi:hypothetical protein